MVLYIGVISIIRIDISKIENWEEIKKLHWKYIEDNVLKKLKNDLSQMDCKTKKDILNILTDDKKSDLEENIYTITMGEKKDWDKFIKRYNKKLLIISEFINTKRHRLNKFIEDIDNKSIDNQVMRGLKKYNENKDISSCKKKEKLLKELGYKSELYIIQELKDIFDYDKFATNNGKWNRHKFLTMLGVEVCPYCNRQYITSYSEDNKNTPKKTTADLDHYYLKSKYPFLALSLYNFIPSCQICNRTHKGDDDRETIYPYEESFDEYGVKFITKLDDKKDVTYLLGDNLNFKIGFTGKEDNENIKNSRSVFKLDEVYQSHKEYVQNLIKRSYFYNEAWIEDIERNFGAQLSLKRKDIMQLLFGNYLDIEDDNKAPLAKLTRDILDELGIEVE